MTEQEHDPKILEKLIERDRHIWEDDVDDHIIVKTYQGNVYIDTLIINLPANSVLQERDDTIEELIILNVIYDKLREAGRLIRVDVSAIGSNENWLRDAINNEQ